MTSEADVGILFNSGHAGIFFTPAVNKEESVYMCLGNKPRNRTSVYYWQHLPWSRDSAVGTATGDWMDEGGVRIRVPVGSRIFSTSFRSVLRPTQPTIQWLQGVKRPGREADHSPPTSAEVENTWIYTCTLPYVFMA
jgi:hypothetical protein